MWWNVAALRVRKRYVRCCEAVLVVQCAIQGEGLVSHADSICPIRSSSVRLHGGVPTLFVNDCPEPAIAYLTYLMDRAQYAEFERAGVRILSVPIYFAGRGINSDSGIGPFSPGLLDSPDRVNWQILEETLGAVVRAAPSCAILPRICLEFPEWWERLHPQEMTILEDGTPRRHSLFSLRWRDAAGKVLTEVVRRLESAPWRDRIVGLHLSAGGTEEWTNHGYPQGARGAAVSGAFSRWCQERGRIAPDGIPCSPGRGDGDLLVGDAYGALRDYWEFISWGTADAILHFSRMVKELTRDRLVVGVFYGYSTEITDPRAGHHALSRVLSDPSVDFLSCPNSYMDGRRLGADWPFMFPGGSLRAHEKLAWIECDTRTCLTRPLRECRPAICPEGAYEGGVWQGPEDLALSRSAIMKSYGRCRSSGVGHWWFDMWGGWYQEESMMTIIGKAVSDACREIDSPMRGSTAEIAVVVDEDAYRLLNPAYGASRAWVYRQRAALGLMGAPYEVFGAGDLELMLAKKFQLVIFLGPCRLRPGLLPSLRSLSSIGILMWCGGPVIITEDGWDPELVREAIGLNLTSAAPLQGLVSVHPNALLPIPGLEEGSRYGDLVGERGWVVDDATAIPFGRFDDGSVGLAMAASGRVVYSSMAGISAPIFRAIAKYAGVHLYVDADAVVYASRDGFLFVHAGPEGVASICAPGVCGAEDMMSDVSYPVCDGCISVAVPPFGSLCLRLRRSGA